MPSLLRSSRGLVLGVVALALAAGSSAAYAATSSQSAAGTPGGAIVSALTAELGISAQQLRSDLGSGETLAQIASANGQTASSLEQAVLSAAQTRLDNAVAAGKLSSAAEQTRLARLSARLDALVNVTHPVARLRLAARLRVAVVRLSAGYLGVTAQQLRSDLRSGQTLAEIAATNGKSTAGLEQAVESAVQTQLDKAVSAGKLTSQREQTLLANLTTRLATLVNHSFS
jgi:hypothetical protein